VIGQFSWGESIVRFFIDAGIGSLIGLLVGWIAIWAMCLTKDALAETLLTLAAPYVAWLTAESLHVSAVLACVAGGLYMQQNISIAVGPASRLQIRTVWDLAVFLVNAMVFLLLGAQFGTLLAVLRGESLATVVRIGAIIAGVAIGVRLVWVPLVTVLRRFSGNGRDRQRPRWKALALVSWTSMRGVVSLATALALPRTLDDGTPFPYRTEIILITMCVIVLTLVIQGLSLEPIIRAFRFAPEHEHVEEERLARREATRRGAEALDDLAHEDWVDQRDVEVSACRSSRAGAHD
jgi:CPA1 family monovalent cation:H+ antiporter